MRRLLVAAALAALAWGPASALEVTPLYSLQLLGGQNFYTGQRGSLAGNVSGLVAPAMKLSDSWSLLPSLYSDYQGTEQVLDVIGGGTLFQSQWDNRLGARAVYAPEGSLWRVKPSASFKHQMLRQTKDEQLGSGLYDYYKLDLGADFEYVYHDPFSVRFGLDLYTTHFPNYTSLESQAATSFAGQSLARELVGDHVLDSQNLLLTAGAEGPLSERLILEGRGALLLQRYPQQHLVDASGGLVAGTRKDVLTSIGAALKMPAELNSDLRVLGTLDAGVSYNSSSQNSYDATQARYLPYYYNFGEVRAGPQFKILLGPARQATIFSLGATYWYRRYPYRPTQDSSGAYVGGSTHMNNWMFTSSLTYPMAPHFALAFSMQHGRADSNQGFEQFYKYHYATTSYLFGLSYDY